MPGAGGGQTGAVLLSPFIKPGTVSEQSYNHYSLLASIEEMFKLGRLGETHLPGTTTSAATYSRRLHRAGVRAPPTAGTRRLRERAGAVGGAPAGRRRSAVLMVAQTRVDMKVIDLAWPFLPVSRHSCAWPPSPD